MSRPKGSKNKRKGKEKIMQDNYLVSDGAGAKEVPILKREVPPEPIVEAQDAPKIDQPATESVVTPPPEETFYCSNCRLHLKDEQIVKQPIDYQRNEDGSLSKAASRFSVFCKNCYKFLRILDRDAQKLLNEMVRKSVR
jgi:hypothetical protein